MVGDPGLYKHRQVAVEDAALQSVAWRDFWYSVAWRIASRSSGWGGGEPVGAPIGAPIPHLPRPRSVPPSLSGLSSCYFVSRGVLALPPPCGEGEGGPGTAARAPQDSAHEFECCIMKLLRAHRACVYGDAEDAVVL